MLHISMVTFVTPKLHSTHSDVWGVYSATLVVIFRNALSKSQKNRYTNLQQLRLFHTFHPLKQATQVKSTAIDLNSRFIEYFTKCLEDYITICIALICIIILQLVFLPYTVYLYIDPHPLGKSRIP